MPVNPCGWTSWDHWDALPVVMDWDDGQPSPLHCCSPAPEPSASVSWAAFVYFLKQKCLISPPKTPSLAQLWVLSDNAVFLPKLNVSSESFRNPNTKSKAASLAAALLMASFLDALWKEQKAQSPRPAGG